jgi:hypothetical protein
VESPETLDDVEVTKVSHESDPHGGNDGGLESVSELQVKSAEST